jgi:hypothetical protein
MTASSAQVRLGAAGVAQVQAFVHLTGHSYIGCFTYQDEGMAPVLAIKDQHIDVSVTVADRSHVTGEDLLMARVLAEAVTRYVAELEGLSTASGEREPGAGVLRGGAGQGRFSGQQS